MQSQIRETIEKLQKINEESTGINSTKDLQNLYAEFIKISETLERSLDSSLLAHVPKNEKGMLWKTLSDAKLDYSGAIYNIINAANRTGEFPEL